MPIARTLIEIEAALNADPFNLELRKSYAHELFSQDQGEAALKQYDLVLGQTKDLQSAVNRIECLYDLGRWAEAKTAFEAWRADVGPSVPSEWDAIFAAGPQTGALTLLKIVPVGLSTGDEDDEDDNGGFGEIEEERVSRLISFDDIVGMHELKDEIRIKILAPFANPELFKKFGKTAGGGVILYGPPGCGKTMMARAIATECKAEFISIGIGEILSKWIGESEGHLGSYFARARAKRPCVLFFDELDALGHSRSKSSGDSLRSLVNEFLTQMDGFGRDNENILILAATNMPWDVDPALKRPGRFARQIFVPPPDRVARQAMFKTKLDSIPQDPLSLEKLAEATEHFSGADIDGIIDLAKEAVLGDILRSGKERNLTQLDLTQSLARSKATTSEWLSTVRNLVRYAGSESVYPEVEEYLKKTKLI